MQSALNATCSTTLTTTAAPSFASTHDTVSATCSTRPIPTHASTIGSPRYGVTSSRPTCSEKGPPSPLGLARPALGRVGINDPRTLALFSALNKGKPYAAQVKPQNFLLSAQVALLGHPPGIDPAKPFHLVAPYHADPSTVAQAALHGPL